MSFACFHLRFDLVREPTPMIGLSARLFTQGKMLAEETLASIITAVCHVLISVRVRVDVGICVNMLMECLSAGSTQLSTGPDSARMARAA